MSTPPYVQPVQSNPFPKGFTLIQFLQTVIAGVSNIPGPLVRPSWQPEPPKQPDLTVNWIGMGIVASVPDANAYLANNESGGALQTQRHEALELQLSIYGPAAIETYGLVRDGFQIPQNRFALFNANMGFTEISPGRHVPDLVNQRWIDRVVCSVFLRREIQRTYPVPSIISSHGIIYVPDIDPDYEQEWAVEP